MLGVKRRCQMSVRMLLRRSHGEFAVAASEIRVFAERVLPSEVLHRWLGGLVVEAWAWA